MFVVELVMQGVRGVRELARLRFQSGFNLVCAGNESGKTTAVDAILHLLFPNGDAGTMDSLVSKHMPDSSRGALVICSDDGAYYRVIQDFRRRAVNLSRYNASSKEFDLLHKDWDSSAQFMAGLAAGAAEDDFAQVFVYRREHAEGRTAPRVSAGIPLPEDKPDPAAAGRGAAGKEKLAELRETLRKAEEAADAEYRYQSAKLTLEEIQKKMAALDETERKKSEIEAALADLKGCENLPENLTQLIEDQERRVSQKLADADDLNGELEALKMQLERIPSANVLTGKLFIAGAVLGVLSILAGVFVLTEEYAHYFPIGVILSLILMAVAAYNDSRKNAQRKAVQRDREALERELVDLERNFVHEGVAIAASMRAVGATSTVELREKADNYRYYRSLRDDLEEGRQRFLGDSTPELMREQYERQRQEADALEKAARELVHDAVDTYGIRQDIERLEREPAAEPDPDWGVAVHDRPPDFASTAADPCRNGFMDELRTASRVGGIEMEALIPAVEAAAQRNLSAVSGGKYVRIEVSQDGPPVVRGREDRVVGESELSHGAKALIYFCLRTGLVEALAGKRRLPFILDDALAGFDPARQQAACQVLRTLGKKTQVLLFTANPALKLPGEPAAELK
jgi:F0F1-type ATP synthase assembly protein I